MRYITIGSGTAVPQRERSAPCHLVRDGGQNLVVDLGPGSTWGLVRHGRVGLQDVGLILFTHYHMDHCADLAPFLFALRSREMVRTDLLTICGPPGLHDHYRSLQATWENRVVPDQFDLTIKEWDGSGFSWRGFYVDAAPTSHSVPNLAWLIRKEAGDGRALIVTGDGGPTRDLVDLARSARHVLVAESAAGPGEVQEGHMNPAQAGELAVNCGSEKLILNHINPGHGSEAVRREAMAHFGGEVVVAEDGMEVEIS